MLYGKLLLSRMDQVFFPLPELQHLLLFSISAVITLFGTQHVLSMNQWLLQFSLECLFFFFFFVWTEARLACSRMSELVKPSWNKYPANLCSHALSLILPLWWTPNFLLTPRMRQISNMLILSLRKTKEQTNPAHTHKIQQTSHDTSGLHEQFYLTCRAFPDVFSLGLLDTGGRYPG